MSDDGQRMAALVALDESGAILERILDAARDSRDRGVVARALSCVDRNDLERAAPVYRRQDEAERQAFAAAARENGVWEVLAPVLEAETA